MNKRIHEYLEIALDAGAKPVIRCIGCGHVFGPAEQNYKLGAVVRLRDLNGLERRSVPPGEQSMIVYQEYLCPGCGVQLQVDSYCPQLDGDDPVVWDIEIRVIPDESR